MISRALLSRRQRRQSGRRSPLRLSKTAFQVPCSRVHVSGSSNLVLDTWNMAPRYRERSMKTPMVARRRYDTASSKKSVGSETDSYLAKVALGKMSVCHGCHAISSGKRWYQDEGRR